ncbi:MAG: hypothetical protein JSW12_17295 [Deltaproteobacteria bacterium]|nr:MAG: hypothetical protein JSW12_17295 [Deltaproteobacteria bacterium]
MKLKKGKSKFTGGTATFPRHNLERALRIPKAILEQNAGRECTEQESASFVGITYNRGPYVVELSSASKFGLLERSSGKVRLTDLARMILRPQDEGARLKGLRNAVLKAPELSDVYERYRGENLPDEQLLNNALVAKFRIPQEKLAEFKAIFKNSLEYAKLIEQTNGKSRILDVSGAGEVPVDTGARVKKLGKGISVSSKDTCLVVMPFAEPQGAYYDQIYKPAIEKAGLRPVRADVEIFGAGKITDQVWRGIKAAKILVAELTTRNPNVFYELGLAHALRKPAVLVSSNEHDVPFDLRHLRVIYYDVMDPFWGRKLIDKVAEDILFAIKNPKEAIFKPEEEG